MGDAAIAGVGRQRQLGFALVVVQRVIEPGDHPCGVAKRRMSRDVFDPLAVDEHGAAVAQRLDIFVAILRPVHLESAITLRSLWPRRSDGRRFAFHGRLDRHADLPGICSFIERLCVYRTSATIR
jgi:hypothetical protein